MRPLPHMLRRIRQRCQLFSRRWKQQPVQRSARSLRLQLLVTVNGVMAVLVAAFLMRDYDRELSARLSQKQVALQEEAKTILPAILQMRSRGTEPMQRYLDAVCIQMRDAESPQHHIAVRVGEVVLESARHGGPVPVKFRTMQRAASRPGASLQIGSRHVVVGRAGAAGTAIFVSEEVSALKQAVIGQILWRLAGMLAMGMIAAAVVSVVLLRTVARPVNRLVAAVTAVSQGNFATHVDGANSRELADLATAFNEMSRQLQRDARARQEEMAKAREIQEHLLPTIAKVPGMNLGVLYRPAADVAGDYYDAIEFGDGSWMVCVADVCGHGVPAAMSAAVLKALLMHAVEDHLDPGELLQFINRRFISLSPPGVFASMLLLRWQPEGARLQYASAGHEPAWLVRTGGWTESLDATGFPLGIDQDATWQSEELSPQAGERLVVTTDGVSEAMTPQGELFGRDRLRELLGGVEPEPLETLLTRVGRVLFEHQGGRPANDDTTMLVVEFTGRAGGIGLRADMHASPVQHS